MSLLSSLLVLIVTARLFGRLFARYSQPELIGEILSGVVLGPALLNLISPNSALAGISELAVFLIMLSAGLEMNFTDIFRAMRGRGMVVSLISFIIPFIAGITVGAVFKLDVMRMVFLGLCISITALPVAIKLLENFGILDTRIARYAIATAVSNDIAALFILGIVLNMPHQLTFTDVAGTAAVSTLKLVSLAAIVLSINWLLERLERHNINIQAVPEALVRYFGAEALFGIVVTSVLIFGSVSEMLGFQFIIGAFFGALLLDKKHFLASRYEDLRGTLTSVTSGFLAPVFFAYLGLEFHAIAFHEMLFSLTVISISIVAKLFAGWLGGKIAGMPNREAMGLGCVLNGRGVMEMVVAGIAYQKGFIGPNLFSTLVLMGIVTTFLTPFLFKRVFPDDKLKQYCDSDI